MNCPECGVDIRVIPVREPLPPSTTASTFTVTGIDYPSTTKEYKCANAKCWVTKIKISWS